jgi:hypothetical protein
VLSLLASFKIIPFSQGFKAGNVGRREGAKVNIAITVRATSKARDSDRKVQDGSAAFQKSLK